MGNLKIDCRIIWMKRFIWDVLIELMEEKGFEGVMVRDLMNKVDINCGIFYLYY